MRINVLKKGDRVININDNFIYIERENKEVDIVPFINEDNTIRIDTNNIITIGYGDNTVEIETDDGVKIINF